MTMNSKNLQSELAATQSRYDRLAHNGKNIEGFSGVLRKLARKIRHLKEEIAKNEE